MRVWLCQTSHDYGGVLISGSMEGYHRDQLENVSRLLVIYKVDFSKPVLDQIYGCITDTQPRGTRIMPQWLYNNYGNVPICTHPII